MAKRQHLKSDSFPKEGCTGEKLSHLVYIHVDTDVETWFSALLTRVPCVGEFIVNQGETFKVAAVYHNLVIEDGKSRFGLNAIIDVELQPEPDRSQRRRVKKSE